MIVNQGSGSQKTPVISVAESGLITATAGAKSSTLQLSSEHDSSFVAGNIRNGVNLFGVKGTLDPIYYAGQTVESASNYLIVPGYQHFLLVNTDNTSGVKLVFCNETMRDWDGSVWLWVWGLNDSLKAYVDRNATLVANDESTWKLTLSSSAGTNPFKADTYYDVYTW